MGYDLECGEYYVLAASACAAASAAAEQDAMWLPSPHTGAASGEIGTWVVGVLFSCSRPALLLGYDCSIASQPSGASVRLAVPFGARLGFQA